MYVKYFNPTVVQMVLIRITSILRIHHSRKVVLNVTFKIGLMVEESEHVCTASW